LAIFFFYKVFCHLDSQGRNFYIVKDVTGMFLKTGKVCIVLSVLLDKLSLEGLF